MANDSTTKTALTVAESGIRWANNILTEIQVSYSHMMPVEARQHLRTATQALSDCYFSIRKR